MKFILMLLGLFIIACMLYGIAAGVQAVARGAIRLIGGRTQPVAKKREKNDAPTHPTSAIQRGISDLQELHQLYNNGALSSEEFAQFKHTLLSTVIPPTAGAEKESQ